MSGDWNHHDRAREIKAFNDTKVGVKGLVDSGITKLPRIFIQPQSSSNAEAAAVKIPVIDLEGGALGNDPVLRGRVVGKMCGAAGTYGFFQLVNHGIPGGVLEEMLSGARGFFEEDVEVKKEYASRDYSRSVVYNGNLYLDNWSAACWRDTLSCVMSPTTPCVEEIPLACRDIVQEYSKQVMELAHLVLELLSEALGLPPKHLKDMGCGEGHVIHCHYSPPCPEPEKTISTPRHSDNTFITLLLQDQIGGLQIMHRRQWFDVPPVPGAFLVNIGDLLQLMSNDKFKSVEHRAVANRIGPRVSVASFFNGTRLLPNPRLYGPIKELLSETNPAKYRQTTLKDYLLAALDIGPNGSGLDRLRL